MFISRSLFHVRNVIYETLDLRIVSVDQACFQQDMTYGDFKDLPRRTASDKESGDKKI